MCAACRVSRHLGCPGRAAAVGALQRPARQRACKLHTGACAPLTVAQVFTFELAAKLAVWGHRYYTSSW